MKRVLRAFLGSALCLCLASAVVLAAPPRGAVRGPSYTVGDFAVELAHAMNLPATSVDSAIAALRGRNISLGVSPSTELTEGNLVNLLSQAGIAVTTADPSKKVSKDRANSIVGTFQAELGRNGIIPSDEGVITSTNPTNPNDDFNNGNGRGGKFKRKKKNSQTGSD